MLGKLCELMMIPLDILYTATNESFVYRNELRKACWGQLNCFEDEKPSPYFRWKVPWQRQTEQRKGKELLNSESLGSIFPLCMALNPNLFLFLLIPYPQIVKFFTDFLFITIRVSQLKARFEPRIQCTKWSYQSRPYSERNTAVTIPSVATKFPQSIKFPHSIHSSHLCHLKMRNRNSSHLVSV